MARVLKPGGHYSLVAWDRLSLNTVAHSVFRVLRDQAPADLIHLFARMDEMGEEGRREQLLRGMGIRSVNSEMFHWDYRFPDFASIWDIVTGAGAFQQMFAPLSEKKREDARQQMEDLLLQYRGQEGSYILPHGCRLIWGSR